jgi:organic radical activating enzyme
VVLDPDDLTFAHAMADDTSTAAHLLVQPVWDSQTAQGLAIHHVKQNPRWRLSLQSHKFLQIR